MTHDLKIEEQYYLVENYRKEIELVVFGFKLLNISYLVENYRKGIE